MPETQAGSGGSERFDPAEDDILSRIVATKRDEVAALERRRYDLRARAEEAAPARRFRVALGGSGRVALIAEVKRRSPGAGEIRPGLDPVGLARTYTDAGASAVSVLTDSHYFGGTLDDLRAVRSAIQAPVLRKDFLISDVQVWEARAAGADAILLIVRILEDGPLHDLRRLAEDLGMGVLVEAHDARELERALDSGATIVGINNRDLKTFTTNLETTIRLVPAIPAGVLTVSESGIGTREQVERLAANGVDAILVGESLLRTADPAERVRALAGVQRRGASVRTALDDDGGSPGGG